MTYAPMKKQNKKTLISHRLINIGLAGIKSFFLAATQVAWGLVSLFGLNLVLSYIITANRQVYPSLINKTFLHLEQFIIENIMLFFFVFWIVYFITDYKELSK